MDKVVDVIVVYVNIDNLVYEERITERLVETKKKFTDEGVTGAIVCLPVRNRPTEVCVLPRY